MLFLESLQKKNLFRKKIYKRMIGFMADTNQVTYLLRILLCSW